MRVGLLLLLLATACYEQPVIPRDKPLRCASTDPTECPAGFRCLPIGVCANEACLTDDQCPLGLVCTDRTGCDLPPADGGAEAGADDAGPILPDGGDAGAPDNRPSGDDALVPGDAPADSLGGGQ